MFQIFLCVLLAAQSIWFPTSAKAESSSFYFRGFSSENVTTNTFAYAISGATLDGTTVQMTSASGTAVGYIALDEDDHDISTSVDLGGLEISFSVVTNVTEEARTARRTTFQPLKYTSAARRIRTRRLVR